MIGNATSPLLIVSSGFFSIAVNIPNPACGMVDSARNNSHSDSGVAHDDEICSPNNASESNIITTCCMNDFTVKKSLCSIRAYCPDGGKKWSLSV